MGSLESIKEYLNILQIEQGQNITKNYVTNKYKKLAKSRHPDKEGGATCDFQKLSEAYRKVIDYIEENQEYEKFERKETDFETEFHEKQYYEGIFSKLCCLYSRSFS